MQLTCSNVLKIVSSLNPNLKGTTPGNMVVSPHGYQKVQMLTQPVLVKPVIMYWAPNTIINSINKMI